MKSPDFDAVKPKSDADLIKAAYSLPLAFKPGELQLTMKTPRA